MGLLFIILFVVVIAIFLCKKFNVSRKIILVITIVMIIIGILIFLLDKFNVINKILETRYSNMPTIAQEQRDNAIAIINFDNFIGFDATSSEKYYIFYSKNNVYSYLKTNSQTTIAGPQEEKINKEGNITNKRQLEKIISKLEESLNSTSHSSLNFYWQGSKVEKEELLDKMFSD